MLRGYEMKTIQIQDSNAKKKQLLIKALKKGHIDEACYSLDGYKEEAVCIEKQKNVWLVYDGERGQQHNLEQYRDFEVAGYRLISRLSDSSETETLIMVDYLTNVLSHAAARPVTSPAHAT